MRAKNAGIRLGVISCPEFLAEGSALHDALHPDRLIIGTSEDDREDGNRFRDLVSPPKTTQVLFVNNEEAELSKLASNAGLQIRVSFINEIARICESSEFDLDVSNISRAIGSDHRIGPYFLVAGPGTGGSCLKKDQQNIIYTANRLEMQMPIIQASIDSNLHQQRRLGETLLRHFGGSLLKMTVAVLGIAFKEKTDDVRESSSVVLISQVLQAGGAVNAYDAVRETCRRLDN